MERVYGSTVATVFTAFVLWTAFGSVFALLLGYSRIPYAAALDGTFFRVFGRVHPEKRSDAAEEHDLAGDANERARLAEMRRRMGELKATAR